MAGMGVSISNDHRELEILRSANCMYSPLALVPRPLRILGFKQGKLILKVSFSSVAHFALSLFSRRPSPLSPVCL
jgi:hypothetical protein